MKCKQTKPFVLIGLFISVLLLTAAFGSKCTNGNEAEIENPLKLSWQDWIKSRQGIALINDAEILEGPKVTISDSGNKRAFFTVLPPTFTDERGKFIGKEGESIEFQLGVEGSIENDRELFKKIKGVENFEYGELGDWQLISAYDSIEERWVARATIKDPELPDQAYSVIECLSTKDSQKTFWDSCKTVIGNAQIVIN